MLDGEGEVEMGNLYILLSILKVSLKTNELWIEGRVCESMDTSNSCGMPSFRTSIFKGKRRKDILTDTMTVSKTSDTRNDYRKAGFFSFVIRMNRRECLYFYNNNFYLEEFSIKKILQALESNKYR